MGESSLRDRGGLSTRPSRGAGLERESGQDSGTRLGDGNGNVKELGDAGAGPGKSFLFFLTGRAP
jgi:hypothetical protein